MHYLSKSKLLSYDQCPKRLYLETHQPELIEYSSATEAAFALGGEVGDIAIKLYGGEDGAFVEYEGGMAAAIERTAELMALNPRIPIYEATFQHDGVLVRVDVLLPDGDGWRIVEVKASTKVKPEHGLDCAIQAWVFESLGHKLSGIALAHIDNTFVYPGNDSYDGLLAEQDLSDQARALRPRVIELVEQARTTLSGDLPEIELSRHCNNPYACGLINHCWHMDAPYPVRGLAGDKNLLGQLVMDGYRDIRDVPADRLRGVKHQRIHRITLAESAELLPEAQTFATELPYPRFYLDFETIGPPIPIWPGTRPYETLAVQWSCHIERETGEIEHTEFLDLSGEPPMRALAESMLVALERDGPILMYTDYEKTVINGLAERFPDLAVRLLGLVERLVDLAPVARENYYHPDMLGSWSIKALMPTIDPTMDYAELEGIKEGTAASSGYLEAVHPDTDAARRAELDEQLRRYCRFDTEAMVRLVQFFATGS